MRSIRKLKRTLKDVAEDKGSCSCGYDKHGCELNYYLVCLAERDESEAINSFGEEILPLLVGHDCTFNELCDVYADTTFPDYRAQHDRYLEEKSNI